MHWEETLLDRLASGRITGLQDASTIGDTIRRCAELQPEHPAFISTGFEPFTYSALWDQVTLLGSSLRRAGFGRDARIAIVLPSGPEAALAIIAVASVAVAVPLDPNFVYTEFERRLPLDRPDALLVRRGDTSAARVVAEQRGLIVIEAESVSEGRLGLRFDVPEIGSAAPALNPEPDATAIIVQTSGTTVADPKLAPRTHRSVLAMADRMRTWFDLTVEDRCLCAIPVFYGHAITVTLLVPLLTGGSIAFPANPRDVDLAEWFGALAPTWYSAGPTLQLSILERARGLPNRRDLHKLRFAMSGGATFAETSRQALETTLGVPVVEHYACTEAGVVATNRPPPAAFKAGTCGIPWPGTLKIVGPDGRELPPGETGDILVGGSTLTAGYVNAPALNRAVFAEGWFHTGDIGSLDAEGFLTIHGRVKEIINRGGEKVGPVEVESALTRHPEVAEAAAFPVLHPRLGEDVAAAVVLKRGAKATPTQLREFLRTQLAAFKVPRRILVLNQLPKGSNGKVQRGRLSAVAAATSETKLPEMASAPSTSDQNEKLELRELWERVINSGPLSIDDDFFEKGGDSLLALEMVLEFERLTGRKIPISAFVETSTIRQLAQKLSETDSLQENPLIEINSNGSSTPLVFFHGDIVGGGHYTKRLARLLGPDQPLIVIAPPGIGGERAPRSIEAMAEDRLALIMASQPQGPYRLAGFCIGGLVALETARLLVAAGEKVEMVAMIDPPSVNARRSAKTILSILACTRPVFGPVVERAMVWAWYRLERLDSLSNMSLSQRWAWVKNKARVLVVAGYDRALTVLRADRPCVMDQATEPTTIPDNIILVGNAIELAISHYFPAPLPVRIIYFSAKFYGKAWLQITSDLELIKMTSGDHELIITDPIELVYHLRARLQRNGGADQKLSS
jgi:acyl-CoA synthetase (AMP-forming)/AMP-acid ligase II/thioesterase domain-containing protein/acyl carrier protein